MHDKAEQNLTVTVARLARLIEFRRRADVGVRALYDALGSQGFNARAVDRALEIMDVSLDDEADDLKQTQAILAAMSSPVQIEAVALVESPVAEATYLDGVRDEGRIARIHWRGRRCASFDEAERRAFLEGYDEMDSILTPLGE